jgi:hypothetical protein
MEGMKNAYKFLVRKPEGTKRLGRPKRRWEDNIRMDIKEIRWEGMDWIHLCQDRGCCEHGNEPSGYIKGGVFLD